MRTTTIFTILALSLMVSLATVGKPTPMGTAWTYQGRLIDANGPADGRYDLQFALFTDPILSSSQIGPTVDVNDLDVIDGYFTVELDFGNSVFNGDARWLEIGVRPWDSGERHTLLSPRQEVTPTPYALYTENAGTDNDWMVSGNDMHSTPSGNVGIGTTNPAEKLHIIGDILLDGGGGIAFTDNNTRIHKSSDDLYLEADDDIYIWPDDDIRMDGTTLFVDGSENRVGIGTTVPGAPLEVKHSDWADIVKIGMSGTLNSLILSSGVDWASISGGTTNQDHIVIRHSTGNVGIGTSTPNSALEVEGTIHTTSGGFKFPDGTTQTTAATESGLLGITVLNVNCELLSSFSTSYAKILDVGSFTKINPSSTIEITFNGRICVISVTGEGAEFELRVDDAATTNGRARANIRSAEAGFDGVPVSITGIFTGLSSGSHTVSIWVRTSTGTGSDAAVDPGCWSTDHIIIKELL
jgi:hypothetical protein